MAARVSDQAQEEHAKQFDQNSDFKDWILRRCALLKHRSQTSRLRTTARKAECWIDTSYGRLCSLVTPGSERIPLTAPLPMLPVIPTYHGTAFSHGEEDLWDLVEPDLSRKRTSPRPSLAPITLADVHCRLWEHLAPPLHPARLKIRERIRYTLNHTPPHLFLESLPVFFHDLDALLFQGILRRRCTFCFANPPSGRRAVAECSSSKIKNSIHCTIFIYVPSDLQQSHVRRSKSYALGTLIHEMLHAYISILTGSIDSARRDQETCWCSSLVYHGRLWAQASQLIANLLGLEELNAEDIHTTIRGHSHA